MLYKIESKIVPSNKVELPDGAIPMHLNTTQVYDGKYMGFQREIVYLLPEQKEMN